MSTLEQPGSAELRLPPEPASVSAARRLVRTLLHEAGRDDLVESAVLLVSEVVTNAMLHAGTTIEVTATLDGAGLRVEVTDGSRHLPTRRHYGTTSGTGRGMLMLEQMVDGWGAYRHSVGKTVWFHLATGDHEVPVLFHKDGGPGAGPGETIAVELRNLPMLLHGAWQEHVEALLREHLLVSMEDDNAVGAIQVHAEATDAIAILEEHVPRLDVAIEPDQLMRQATEPHVTMASLVLPVPTGSVPHFDTLDRAVEEALALANAGRILTPETQPELRHFRHWLCRQVVEQAAGAPPAPWAVEEEPAVAQRHPVAFDPALVHEASTGVIAADEAGVMLALNRSVLDLLGYDEESELIGRRIVSIVPERYRQAHLAGFTMYVLEGRRPLLDTEVAVPALRRDGTEVAVLLLVTAQQAGGGAHLLLGRVRPAG